MADDFMCSICASILSTPVRTPCGHFFCLACLRAWLPRSATCPLCRAPLHALPAPDAAKAAQLREPALQLATADYSPLDEIPAAALTCAPAAAGLGEGATCRVHRGAWGGLPVAVKRLKPQDAAGNPAAATNFRREIKSLAQLQHPNIVRALGFCREGDASATPQQPATTLLVLELADCTLLQRLQAARGPLPLAQALRFGADIASALTYLHARGVTHNDLKSPNVLLAGGAACLTDFGLVRLSGRAPDAILLSAAPRQGDFLGTPHWAAPENFSDLLPGAGMPPGDVYSLGGVLFEMATGEIPWGSEDKPDFSVISEVRAGRRPAIPAAVPAALRALITRCWAHDPAQRPSAAEALVELQRALAEAEGAAPGAPPPPPRATHTCIATLRSPAFDAGVAAAACGELTRLAALGEAYKEEGVRAGAVGVLGGALARHGAHAALCKAACEAMANLAHGRDAGGEARRGAFVAHGALQALARALHGSAAQPSVCRAAASAILVLLSGAGASAQRARSQLPEGMLQDLVRALQWHAGEADVCVNALGALVKAAWGSAASCAALRALPEGAEALARAAGDRHEACRGNAELVVRMLAPGAACAIA